MSSRTFKLAVLSDQHIDSRHHPDSWDLACTMFEAVAARKPDHVVIVGDTFDSAGAMQRDRAAVKRELRRLGLWKRDRLTIVVGNHDVFRVSGRASRTTQFRQVLTAAARRDAGDHYQAFCDWAGELARPADLLDEDGDLFPLHKDLGHVRLLASDSTGRVTGDVAISCFRDAEEQCLRSGEDGRDCRRVLATHGPPIQSQPQSLSSLFQEELEYGYLASDLERLEQVVKDLQVEAILCGHIHDPGDDRYSWKVTRSCRAHLMGRSGAMDDTNPTFALLKIPAVGTMSYTEVLP
ncbi:MAG: metallophosphoesterase [Pseudomonadota bacterium]